MRTLIIQILAIMIYSNLQAQNELSVLNDEFNNNESLADWKSHHQNEGWPSFTEKYSVLENEACFYVEPKSSGWYGEFHRGPFFYKDVTGDFTVITKIKTTGKKADSPERSYSLAGLMLRAPRPSNVSKDEKGYENWMFLSTGSATKKGKPQFESKNTVKGKSKLKVFPARQGWIYIAISRVGNTFYQLYRYEDTKKWVLLRVVKRDDMPGNLQVGMLAYTDFWPLFFKFYPSRSKFNTKPHDARPDLIAKFDYMHFYRIDDSIKAPDFKEGYHLTELTKEQAQTLSLEQ